MWNPIRIEIYNLFAHKESVYNFKQNECVLIFGKNETDRNLENNGAGKTTLFEAICIALTNESLRAIKKDNFINREEEDCKIIFYLENPVLRMKLKIVRQFFRGNKAVKVEIWENDKLKKQIVSVNEANKRVFELIGISREDLLRYFIISQDSRYTFFTASDVDKKEVMNRITSADMINPAIEELDLRYKEKQAEYNEINDQLTKLYARREVIDEQLKEAEASDNTAEELENLNGRINETNDLIVEVDENLKNVSISIKAKIKEILKIEVVDLNVLKQSRKKLQEVCDGLETQINETKRVKKTLNSELEDTIICPKCNHEFIYESELDLSIKQVKALIKNAEKEILDNEKILKFKSEKLKAIKAKITKAENDEETRSGLEVDKSGLLRKKKNYKEEREELVQKVEKLIEEKEELKKRKKDDKVLNGLKQKIKDCDEEIDKVIIKLKAVNEDWELIKFWQFYMGKSGFMTYLANKSVKIIEGITNSYLRKFKVDISVLINGFTILRSGEVREKIDIFVLNDGVTAEAFMAKSGGERGRVTLAGVLGIQHLINLSLNGKGLNLLCFDECFYGMDGKGQENIIKIFEKIGITILVITQNVTESFNNENTLQVVKENGISRYI